MTEDRVLVVEDDPSLREALCDTLQLAGYEAVQAGDGRAALHTLSLEDIRLVVTDVRMPYLDGHGLLRQIKARQPGTPVLVMTAYSTVEDAVRAMRDGASDYLVKPFAPDALIERVQRFLTASSAEEMVAADPATRTLLETARRVADSDVTVMITGDSGTGKEIFARFIHSHSRRAAGPFIAINCAAIPENMLEATLFGYEKGAFTGAHQACPGKFEQAQGGTLLLDEISEMDLALQVKLLRVLQEKEVERLGGRKCITLDVRVLATSNRDLGAEVRAGRFRSDLFYRLNVFPLHLLPLQDRPGDILPLARRALASAARANGRAVPALSEAACARLLQHPWPGNVRELDNLMQRTLILQPGAEIHEEDLRFEPCSVVSKIPAAEPHRAESLDEDLRSREEEMILTTLRAVTGNRAAAAARLGISPRTLRYKLARMRAAGIAIPGENV